MTEIVVEHFRQYVLGELSTEHQEQVEHQLLADRGALDELEAVEDELLLQDIRGELDDAQTAALRRYLHAVGGAQERRAFLEALDAWASAGTARTRRWFHPPGWIPRSLRRAAAYAAVLVLGLSGGWLMSDALGPRAAPPGGATEQTTGRGEPNNRQPPVTPGQRSPTVVLPSTVVRTPSTRLVVSLPLPAVDMAVELNDADIAAYPTFSLSIADDRGIERWSSRPQAPSAGALRIQVPFEAVPPGLITVFLRGHVGSEDYTLREYPLDVRR